MKYSILVESFESLEGTPKRLEKTYILSELLKKTPKDDLRHVIYLSQGKVFPIWDERVIGMSSKLMVKVIASTAGVSKDKVEDLWKKEGDLGLVAQILLNENRQRRLHFSELTVRRVFENLQKLASLEGKGSIERKVQLVAELLSNAKPNEAKFIVKNVLNELRIGVAEGTLRDAIVWAFFAKETKFSYDKKDNSFDVDREHYNKYIDIVQEAYDVTNDYGEVAEIIKEKGIKGLDKLSINPLNPINVMLYQKARDIEEGFKAVGSPAFLEYKYDGFRLLCNKHKGKIRLFTRRLDDVSKQFPDVVDYVNKYVKGNSFILDSEVVGYDPKSGKYLPFQAISQRIRRKYHIDKMAKDFPVEVNVFDIIYYNGKSLLKKEFKERRRLLEKIIEQQSKKIRLAKQILTDDVKKATKFYEESLQEGEEGIMMKNITGVYKPGSRVGYGVKIKSTLEPLDLVIVKAEWGEGKRAKWLSSYTIACRREDKFLEIGKASTGLKEKKEEGLSFEDMTMELKPLIISEKGREVVVKPKIIIEVGYEEIQKSPTYESGYALRFPRVIRIRNEKSLKDIDDIERIDNLYKQQKK